jgi:hypothetical protein
VQVSAEENQNKEMVSSGDASYLDKKVRWKKTAAKWIIPTYAVNESTLHPFTKVFL